ncbi:hypothetical protein GHU26_17650 [Pseudomonas aeruginosa]|nr:hypothetical protein [Pseudomonas aeruginosa]
MRFSSVDLYQAALDGQHAAAVHRLFGAGLVGQADAGIVGQAGAGLVGEGGAGLVGQL